MVRARRAMGVAFVAVLVGCATTDVGDTGAPVDTGSPHDAGNDARRDVIDVPPVDVAIDHGADASIDAASDRAIDTGAPDASPPDVTVFDTGTPDTGAPDVGPPDTGVTDMGVTDSGPIACATAGGRCVALTPTSCPPPSMVGSASMYSCGGGLGVECCLPPADAGPPPTDAAPDATGSNMPVCMNAGTSTEGWYTMSGMLLCLVSCAGQTVACQRIGTTAQGWYTARGHGCPPYSQLIVHDPTCI